MGRYKESGTESEAFQECMRNETGPVECMVCEVRFFQGNKGQAMHVCKGCSRYVCVEHKYRHPHCEMGR